MTFTVVAHDPETGDFGIAVASKALAAGSVVPWARAGVGAVATQAGANVTYGPRGLDLLAGGHPPEDVVATLTGADPQAAHRQLAVMDARGHAALFTGGECRPWAGGTAGTGCACLGNILAGPEVVAAMTAALEATPGDLDVRLLAALFAGQAAGGDRRGRQSAAMLVVREPGAFWHDDRRLDLRVDDHADPIAELGRILNLWRDAARLPPHAVAQDGSRPAR
jgi:uncharacterized Ntn-hydrolase superfamily protein